MDYGGIVPNVSTFNILVKAYSCHSFLFKVAFKVLNKMSEHGCSPCKVYARKEKFNTLKI
uniref:Uncharacterized protein n=1 Tax=Nelumbo nucifera TaxID=4432 RepID=A0A822ZKN7_NELNU|nr:TPA_asm: hypothetical protein HUJ06_001796 [Nelumbo nucifera]